MKIKIVLFGLLMLGCINHEMIDKKLIDKSTFYVGTYTDTESKGIYKYSLSKDGVLQLIALVAETNNPSYLTISANKQFLLANTEIDKVGFGTVESYLISGDSLVFISSSSSGGAHPCFVNVNEQGFVLAANYTSGNVGLLRINNKGELSKILDLRKHEGKGLTERQDGPHAHSAWFDPISNIVISADLGTNELWFYKLDTVQQKLLTSVPSQLAMEEGAGPRHLVFHPNNKWLYIVNELNSTVTLVNRLDSNGFQIGNSVSTLPTEYNGTNLCADIHVSFDGEFVYASNRGHNTIAIFEVNMKDGSLTLIGNESTHGDWPRNFSLSPDNSLLLVANQHSNNIVSFKRDKKTGLLQYLSEIDAPSPACILFN